MQLHDFGFVNYAVLFGYLAAMLLVGVYFSKRQKTADDYFRAGGRVPGWAAGVSVFATTLSSITFMSIPAKAYTSDCNHHLFDRTRTTSFHRDRPDYISCTD